MTGHEIVLGVIIFIVSFFSVVSGGVGLLARPILILAGFPPAIALGSFRVANLVGRIVGLGGFVQKSTLKIDWKLAFFLFIPSFIGGILGAELVTYLNADVIKAILGVFVLVMGVLLLFEKKAGLVDTEEVLTTPKKWVGFISTIFIGIIASFIGGSGFLFAYLLIFVYHKSFISAAAIRKITNVGSALSASILFIYHGDVNWRLAMILLVADGLGEYLGARYQVKKGEEWIRRISLIIIFICGIALFF